MTREEAIKSLQNIIEYWTYKPTEVEAAKMAIAALRPVSREQVEKMKKEPVEGEYDELYAPTYKCPECGFENIGSGNFCRNCGCLYTDKAVDMVMERLEALRDGKGD
ncbi:MAG: hypothetical protein E7B44_15325 [Flavonifractor plautii]|nr:hypothetical protein [Flavonifractor plautii]